MDPITNLPGKDFSLPAMRRTLELRSYDEKTNTAEMVFSTGSRVKRGGIWTDPYIEELSMDASHVRTDRLDNGTVPYLKNHGSIYGAEIEDVLGRIVGYEFKNGEATAKVRFAERPEVQGLIQDIRAGVINNVSVGYRIHKMEKVGQEGDVPVLRATDWEVLEISSVAIGADPNAAMRSEKNEMFKVQVTGLERKVEIKPVTGSEVDERKSLANPETLIQDTNTGDKRVMDEKQKEALELAKKEAREAEAKRASTIMAEVRKVGLEASLAEKLIADEVSLDDARSMIIDKVAERDAKNKKEIDGRNPTVEITRDEVDTFRKGVSEGLLTRFDSKKFAPTELGKDFRNMSLVEVAAEALSIRGEKVRGMSKQEIVKRAFNSTSDFPLILADVAGKSLRRGYDEAPASYGPIVREIDLPDFKSVKRNQLGDYPLPELKLEGGEIKRGKISEAKESYSLATYAKGFAITREAIINDDLNAFSEVPMKAGQACRHLISDKVWDVFNANAAMGDGIALFHASHSNLSTGVATILAGLESMRTKMKKQVSLDTRKMNLMGKYLIVPADRETEAEQAVSGIVVPSSASNANVYARTLQIISEARLSSTVAFYLAASLDQVDMIELAYLQGQRAPQMNETVKFGVGMDLEVMLDFAVKPIDFRGLQKHAGA